MLKSSIQYQKSSVVLTSTRLRTPALDNTADTLYYCFISYEATDCITYPVFYGIRCPTAYVHKIPRSENIKRSQQFLS
jgi:hypothetical protein